MYFVKANGFAMNNIRRGDKTAAENPESLDSNTENEERPDDSMTYELVRQERGNIWLQVQNSKKMCHGTTRRGRRIKR